MVAQIKKGQITLAGATKERKEREEKSRARVAKRQAERAATKYLSKEERRETPSGAARLEAVREKVRQESGGERELQVTGRGQFVTVKATRETPRPLAGRAEPQPTKTPGQYRIITADTVRRTESSPDEYGYTTQTVTQGRPRGAIVDVTLEGESIFTPEERESYAIGTTADKRSKKKPPVTYGPQPSISDVGIVSEREATQQERTREFLRANLPKPRAPIQGPVQKFGPEGRFTYKGTSAAGVLERAANVGGVFTEITEKNLGATGKIDLQARGVSGKGALLLETAAEHPLLTAGVATSSILLAQGAVVGGLAGSAKGAALAKTLGAVKGATTTAKLAAYGLSSASTAFAAKQAADLAVLTSEEAEAARKPGVRQAFSASLARQQQEAGDEGTRLPFVVFREKGSHKRGSLGIEKLNVTGLPGVKTTRKGLFAVSSLTGSAEQFDDISGQELASRGVTDPNAQTALTKQRVTGGLGELAGLIQISVSSELVGRGSQAALTKHLGPLTSTGVKGFMQQASRTAISILPAGALEGASAVSIQQTSREEDPSIKKVALGGAIGAASAAIIGGAIGGFAHTKKHVARFSTEVAADISDPLELPGDIIASGLEKLTKSGAGGAGVRVHALVPSLTTNKASTFTGTPTPTPAPVGGFTTTTTIAPTPTSAPVQVPTQVPTRSLVPTKVLIDTPTTPIIPTPTRTKTPVDVPTPPFVPTPPVVPTPVNIPTSTKTGVPVGIPVNVPVNVPVNIPTVTPRLTIFPPIIPLGGGGGGTRASVIKTWKLSGAFGFTPSLGGAVFNIGVTPGKKGTIYSGLGFRRAKPAKKTKKKKRGKKGPRKASSSGIATNRRLNAAVRL